MLTRPFVKDGKKHVYPHTHRFNDALNRMVSTKKFSHIMEIQLPEDRSLFDLSGELSTDGKEIFWREINKQMKQLDKGEIDLMPKEIISQEPSQTKQIAGNKEPAQQSIRYTQENWNKKDTFFTRRPRKHKFNNFFRGNIKKKLSRF